MTLVLAPLEDADVEQTAIIERIAFRCDGGLGVLLTPSPDLTPEELEQTSADRRKALKEDPLAHFMKVTDTETGQIIAYAQWSINTVDRTEEQMERVTNLRSPPPDANVQAWNDFFGHIVEARKTILGPKPAAFLRVLTTLPEHHRRGAGTMLVKYGCDKADEAGIRAYLEASPMGKPLYDRFRFQGGGEHRFPT